MKAAALFLIIFAAGMCLAQQDTTVLNPWTTLYKSDGVEASFIYYGQSAKNSDGVVVKMRNFNDYGVDYNFVLIFRSDTLVKQESVSGNLKAHEIKTGSSEGLFWMPFSRGTWISEVGVRSFKIIRRGK